MKIVLGIIFGPGREKVIGSKKIHSVGKAIPGQSLRVPGG
jgi:hypothetical protein